MARQLLRESICMDAKYYTDITDSAPEAIKESMNKNPHVAQDTLRESNDVIASEAKSAICQLKEANVISDSIVNAVVSKLRERGVSLNERKIYRVPVGRWDNINGNRRRYTRKLWENVMNNQQSAWKGLCGLADHPSADNDPGSIKNSSIVWLGMELDDAEKIVYGIGTFVGILGHMFQEIIDAGGRVGFSSSGFGEIMADGQTVNPDTYQIERLADVVLNPSQEVYGEISNEQKGLGNIEYNKQTAVQESANDNLKESVIMENNTRPSILSKVEEKAFRNYVKAFIEDSNSIKSPNEQLKELKSINEMFEEGVAPDLKAQLEEKIAAKQAELETLIEEAVSMKEELGVDSLEEITEGTKRVIEEGAELAKQVENYKAIVEGMTEKNKELSTKITTLEESNKANTAQIENLTKENNGLNETVKALSLKITIQEAEALENAGKITEASNADATKIADLTAKLTEAKKTIEDNISNKVKVEEALHVSELKLTEAENANKELETALAKANLKLKVRESRAEQDNVNRNTAVVQIQEALDKANADIEELKKVNEAKIADLNAKINQYRDGNDKLEKANSVLESKVKTANSMLNNLSTANTALNESIKTIKDTANAEKDAFIKNLNESIAKINENGSYELKVDPNGTLTVNVNTAAEPVAAPVEVVPEAPVEEEPFEGFDESKKLGQYINFRDSLPIEKYWADQYSQFGEALVPFEHKIRDAKTLAEAQREFFKALPFISGKIREARINPKYVRQERLEESHLPVENKTSRPSMAAKFGLI